MILENGDGTPYNQNDHYHCWETEDGEFPPCGQKIEHLKCCLCELPNPKCRPSKEEKCVLGNCLGIARPSKQKIEKRNLLQTIEWVFLNNIKHVGDNEHTYYGTPARLLEDIAVNIDRENERG